MKSMAAIHLEYGDKVKVEEIDIPDPLDTQVIVKLKSTGVCHSQLHQMNSSETTRPISLGHEGAGYVEKIGKIKVVSVASIIGEALRSIFSDDSVSEIFMGENVL